MRNSSAIGLALLFSLVISTESFAGNDSYGWTVSRSDVDPHVQSGSPTGGVDTLYLWFVCPDPLNTGMSAAEMTLQSTPPGQVLAFNVMNGYLNAGNATNLLLAVGGCPSGPVVAGGILILHFLPVAICLGGANVTVDCTANPQAWPNRHKGYVDLGLPFCLGDSEPCGGFSVENSSWGTIKSLYR